MLLLHFKIFKRTKNIFQNIFQTLDTEQQKLILTRFNQENILSSLALETGTMNNNLIINSMLLQPTFIS